MANDGFSTTRAAADSELTTNISATVGTLLTAGSVRDTLGRVVELAVTTIEGCDFAGIFVLDEGTVATPVYTDQVVTDLDDLQRQAGEGPCLDAAQPGRDLLRRRLGPRRPVAAIRHRGGGPWDPQPVGVAVSAERHAWGSQSLRPPPRRVQCHRPGPGAPAGGHRRIGSHGGPDPRGGGTRRADNLHAALATREIIGQAQGILMERERLSADQAFDVLRRASQHLNLKLRDVAQSLVDTGERPDTGRPR